MPGLVGACSEPGSESFGTVGSLPRFGSCVLGLVDSSSGLDSTGFGFGGSCSFTSSVGVPEPC